MGFKPGAEEFDSPFALHRVDVFHHRMCFALSFFQVPYSADPAVLHHHGVGCGIMHEMACRGGCGGPASFAYLQPLPDYLYEITHDYQGPIKGIVTYLNQHARKDETVAMTYGDLPVKFYTGMRVIGGLTGEDLAPAREADWVILRKYVLCQTDWQVRKYLVENLPWYAFQKITIDYPDLPWENRETPSEHHYRTVTNEDKVAIYRRIK